MTPIRLEAIPRKLLELETSNLVGGPLYCEYRAGAEIISLKVGVA